jgi:outer membrane protein
MKMTLRAAAAALTLGLVAGSAVAADLPVRTDAPAPAPMMTGFDPWMIRIRAVGVLPSSSGRVYTPGGLIPGSNLKVSNSVVPELDITYFFTPNIAVEAICCVTPHKITAKGSIAALGEIGRTVVFPPTVLLQYHFTGMGALKPYVGIGVNYTHYFRDSTGPNFAALRVKDSWGVAAQVGFDYMLNRNWGINFDVKKIMMRPDATVTLLPGGPLPLRAKAKIDPWIVGVGVTYRFGGGSSAILAKY